MTCVWNNGVRADKGDAGKFEGFFHHKKSNRNPFLFLACDDDIIYPPDYVEVMKAAVLRDPKAIHSCHGRNFTRFPVRSYYREGVKYHCLADVSYSGTLHCAGTGVMAFMSDAIDLQPQDFGNGFMADIWLAKAAARQGVPLRMVPHRAGWLKLTGMVKEEDTIWAKFHNNDSVQTNEINTIYHSH